MTPPLFHTPLNTDQQRDFGLPVPQPLAMADQVRFSELDPLNHVNNAVYMSWFERVRIRYSQEWGLSRYDGGPDNPRIVLHSAQIRYLQEMRLNDVYVVTARCASFRTASYTIDQQLWSKNALCATLSCVLVLLTQDGSTKHPIPDLVRTRFQTLDGARFDPSS